MRRVVTVAATVAIPVAVVLAVAFGLGSVLAACGDESPSPAATETVTVTATPTPTVAPTDDPSAVMTVSLYFMRGEFLGVAHRTVPASEMPATAAMNALLGGPDAREKAAGLGTAIPKGTTLNGLSIEAGTARVDLSGEFASGGGSLSMQARVAEVVYTLTQFRTVKRVDFLIDGALVETLGGEGLLLGTGQRRADWKDLLPAIFVESPAVGDVVTQSLLTVRGSASVFEATFQGEVIGPSGESVMTITITGTRGAPQRGVFDVRLKLPAMTGDGELVVYDESMADGARIDEVRIPLRFAVEE